MEAQEFKKLLDRYLEGKSTAEENAWLEAWYMNYGKNNLPLNEQDLLLHQQQIWAQFIEKNSFEVKRTRLWPRIAGFRIAAAAAVLLVVGSGLFFYNRYNSAQRHLAGSAATRDLANDIKPGGNKAYLVLSNGKRLSLTDAANGSLAKEAGVEITKTADGQVVYASRHLDDRRDLSSLRSVEMTATNTIETPKGGQYQIVLPDGSKVWLNAASKLIYPVTFNGRGQREVFLSGEAYFEVAKDKQHPFKVKSAGQVVTVLGTHFNISSYSDESNVKTTLLEGSVKVNDAILKPGEQATLQANKIKVAEVNVSDAIDWKNGYFIFKNENLVQIMQRISRWYDIDVSYEGSVDKTQTFGGKVSRAKNISEVLKSMQSTGQIKFKIEGKKITVMQNVI